MAKTPEEIRESLKKSINYENPQIDLISGNVATDLGVNAFSDELASVSEEQDRIRNVYLGNAASFTDTEANQYAASFGIKRLEATRATGIVVFCSSTRPEQGTVITIPKGTVVATSNDGTDQARFTTITIGTIKYNTPLNPSTNYYEVEVHVQANTTGTKNNVGAGTINTLISSVAGISAVYNPNSLVNGTDKETTPELLERVNLRLRGFVFGTKASYLAKVYEDPVVRDAVVVDPNSEFSVRGPGSIDIYIIGSKPDNFTQRVVNGEMKQTMYFTKAPVLDDNSITVTLEGGIDVPKDNYTIVHDGSTKYASSYKAKDSLIWNEQYFNQVVKTKAYYEVTYSYNRLMTDLQDTFASDDYNIITSDVLIKDTSSLPVAMDFDIVTLPGYDGAAVRNQVVYSIQNFVNKFTLNKTLRQSDIIGLVENTDGVDYLKLPMRRFSLKNATGVSDIEASPLEHIVIDSTDILVG